MSFIDENEEVQLFQKVATSIGESLEAVYNMQAKEREELITVLELRRKDVMHEGSKKDKVGEIPVEYNMSSQDSFSELNFSQLESEAFFSNQKVGTRNETVDVSGSETKDDVLENGHGVGDLGGSTNVAGMEFHLFEESAAPVPIKDDLNNNENKPKSISVLDTTSESGVLLNPEAAEDPIISKLEALQHDTDLALRLLGPDPGPVINADLVQAYLEAHMNRPDRVQFVVEELLGLGQNDSQTPERQLSVEMSLEKGKGKGKSRKTVNPLNLENRLVVAQKRGFPQFARDATSPEIGKKPRLQLGDDDTMAITFNDLSLPSSPTTTSSQFSPSSRAFPSLSLSQNATPSKTLTPDAPVKNSASSALVDSLSAMFPQTPLDYILARCPDLVGKEAAFERFVEELLSSPLPPPNWRLMYKPLTSLATLDTAFLPSLSPSVASPAGPSGSGLQNSSLGALSVPDQQIGIQLWEEEKYEELLSIFPTICPEFLQKQVLLISRIEGQLPTREVTGDGNIAFETIVERLLSITPEERVPTRIQWMQKEKERQELEKWSGKMTPGDFLDIFEDPAKYFNNRREVTEEYKAHALAELKGMFRYQSNSNITRIFRWCNFLLAPAVKHLKLADNTRKTRRAECEFRAPVGRSCIMFLKEKKFIELEEYIEIVRKRRAALKDQKIVSARLAGSLVECECCFSQECLEEEMVRCDMYCRECVEASTNVAMGEGKTIMECLGQCNKEISWQELARALQPTVLSKLIQKRQAEEVEMAGMEGVVACPFCPYLTIMENVADRVLVCRNPDCGRQSCRLCREPNHIPLRCEEVKKGEQVRKKIEEQLTEAMLRECWKCKNKFYKEEGCNKMTCRCGAKMCYLCKKEVADYSHFYGQGGTSTAIKTCPLFSDNKVLYQMEIAKAAELAKQELEEGSVTLTSDPTEGIVMPKDLPVSEDVVRGRVFNRWLEVTAMVEESSNPANKARLHVLLENIRKDIAGRQVVQLEDQVVRLLEVVRVDLQG